MRMICGAAIALATLCLWFIPAANAQPGTQPKQSAYDSLDPAELTRELSEMGMSELLHAYADELREKAGDSPEVLALMVDIRQNAAMQARDFETRNQLLDKTAGVLRKLIEAAENAGDPEKQLACLGYRLRLAEILGSIYTKPYCDRLLYLQGGPADRRVIVEKTREAVRILRVVNGKLDEKMKTWASGTAKEVMICLPRVEDMQKLVRYRSAWIYFFRGMALTVDKENLANRRRLLNDAIQAVEEFARGEREWPVRYWSMLLTGMCCRELGLTAEKAGKANWHDQAAEHYADILRISADRTGVEIRIQTRFEMSRNLIEKGDFKAAEKATGEFVAACERLLGKSRSARLQSDVKSALLGIFLYEEWARHVRVSDPKKADDYDLKAQDFILEFLTKYPVEGEDFLRDVVAQKYRDRTDYEKLNSAILLALTSYETARKTPESLDKAEKILAVILNRKDKHSLKVRPAALWRQGLLLNARRQSRRSARAFGKLAKEYPNDKLAEHAARNAVISYKEVLKDLREKRKPISVALRIEYIDALKTLLENPRWGGTDKARGLRNHELGDQCRRMSKVSAARDSVKWLAEAIKAYRRVEPGAPEHMSAQSWVLELRVELVLAPPVEGSETEKPEALAADLKRFAESARLAADSARDEVGRKELLDWGARAAFNAVVLYGEKLDQKVIANRLLDELPDKWPGTPILQRVTEYRIRKALEALQTDRAIRLTREYERKYPDKPEKHQELIRMLVSQMLEQIETLRGRSAKQDRLRKLREAYSSFAGKLFEPVASKPLKDRYAETQMYADALVKGAQAARGRGDEDSAKKKFQLALKLFEQCMEHNNRRRAREAERIDKEYAEYLRAVERAGLNEVRVRSLTGEQLARLEKLNLKVDELSKAWLLKETLGFLDRGDVSSDEKHKRLEDVAARLRESVIELRDLLKRSVGSDPRNVLGLARSKRGLRQYGQAREHYRAIVGGLDAETAAKLYWRIQLEYCEFILEASGGKAKARKALEVRIRQLQLRNPQMGGLYARFNELRAKARERAGD